jgi:hypothetical protein
VSGAASSVMTEFLGEPSWVLRSDVVALAVTRRGAHMAPVTFARTGAAPIAPYAISPWQQPGELRPQVGSERGLRGDFFCLPFGKGSAPDGIHPPHGATSQSDWTLVAQTSEGGIHRLTLALETPIRTGRVERAFLLRDGHDAVYTETTVHGFAGPATFGHHAVLRMPDAEGALRVSTSPISVGMTFPQPFADPAKGEQQGLAVGARFEDLHAVPAFAEGSAVDCTSFPARAGCTDLLQIATTPSKSEPAWTVAVNTQEGYLWFALKDALVLPSTVFWIENRGRHNEPWNSRTVLLGLEDVCTYFDLGINAASVPNAFSEAGFATSRVLGNVPLVVRTVQGAVRVPAEFGRVESVAFTQSEVTFADAAEHIVAAKADWDFVFGGSHC